MPGQRRIVCVVIEAIFQGENRGKKSIQFPGCAQSFQRRPRRREIIPGSG
jgi:hypothetical protein